MRWIVPMLVVLCAACGGPFSLRRPVDFVELDPLEQARAGYALRAVSADGVVLAVRAIDDPRGASQRFWAEAIRNQVQRGGGYALIEEGELRAASGELGLRIRVGRADDGHAYRYWVAVFAAAGRVFVIEAGGREEQFTAAEAELEAAFTSFRIR